jgi:cobalt-zinc-cadmium efflux system membrane fusion protein
MKRITIYVLGMTAICAAACGSGKKEPARQTTDTKPLVKDSGRIIQFPPDSLTLSFFETETVSRSSLHAALAAPARVAATVIRSNENPAQNLVLFDNPDLTANYTSMLQHIVSIREKGSIIKQKNAIAAQKQIEVERFTDLASHGAGTGKDVSDAKTDLITAQTDMALAETDLANEKTAIIEHEARLKLAGFNPQDLVNAKPDKVWVICDIPENQVDKIKEGASCTLQFTSYPGETFTGKIEDVGDVVDNITRMVKLRIGLPNTGNKLRAGMYATVHFGVDEGVSLSISKNSMLTVQGKNYVFVQHPDHSFERKEIITGPQVNDRIIVFGGVQEGDAVVTRGAMQLKGISFGY